MPKLAFLLLFHIYIVSTLIQFGFWQNLKMKISHPRFVNIGNQESMKSELPACLMKKVDSVSSGANANPFNMSDTVFMFPEVSMECFSFKFCSTSLI